MNRDPI
jgi:hypothetical protein